MTSILLLGSFLLAHQTQPDQTLWDNQVDKAVAFLRKSQLADGSWSSKLSPGITGLVITGLLRTGKVPADDPMVEKGLRYIESLINPKAGHIAGPDPKVQLQNYVTSVNVMALVEANRETYRPVIRDAARFLRQLQWDEAEGKDPKNDYYGGAGYDSKSRPDLSNTQIFLDALVAAGVPPKDPAFQKALVFVSRCQNLAGETNDQPWAGKINDGSFIYSPAAAGATKTQDQATANGGLPGYASMTYAGIKSMVYCGLDPKDPRMQEALKYISKNYALDRHPGMPAERASWGLYYYYQTLSKCLDTLKLDEIKDSSGKSHPWRVELVAELAKRQKDDGSYTNAQDRWMESNPDLVTAYALIALAHAKGVKKP
jgi:squalene-hopene/tetraprenyl-beta-curcumene cyclase